jgi:hypothetical protein
MATKSEEEAKRTAYSLFVAPRPYSFELSPEMLELLRKEFDPPIIVAKFAEAIADKKGTEIDTVAEKIFCEYGEQWMRKTFQLGEEYPDRTYEVLKEAADQTGELVFPLVLQRFIEIAYLSTQQFRILPIVENWGRRLVYKVTDCHTFKTLQDKCGSEATSLLPCRHACLTMCRTGCQGLNLDATVDMDATMVRDSYCQFAINRI